jgi:hypothetical protein
VGTGCDRGPGLLPCNHHVVMPDVPKCVLTCLASVCCWCVGAANGSLLCHAARVFTDLLVACLMLLFVCCCCCFGAAAADVQGVPGFWATILGRAEMVLSEKDAEALTYLTGELRKEGGWSLSL